MVSKDLKNAIDYELSLYFSGELLQSIKICGPFDVYFDHALNKKVQKHVLNQINDCKHW